MSGIDVRVFETKWFGYVRYARRERIGDHSLCGAIERAERGIVDADLGGASSSKGSHGRGKAVQVGIGC